LRAAEEQADAPDGAVAKNEKILPRWPLQRLRRRCSLMGEGVEDDVDAHGEGFFDGEFAGVVWVFVLAFPAVGEG
jgi:hypothetical protein